MHTKPRVLVLGDGAVPSGFARVIRAVFGRLHRHYDVHHLALGYYGDPHQERWPLYAAAANGDPLGTNRIERLVAELQPDLVFLIHEPSVASEWTRVLKRCINPSRIVVYMAIEAGPLNLGVVDEMRGIGRWVTYTSFARREAMAVADRSADIDVIPHGVDTDTFRPLPRRRRAARRALGLPDGRDAFIVLNGNRNQGRKSIDVTIAGFTQFAQDKPADVKLYLHMGRRDLGWDLDELCRRHRLGDRVVCATTDVRPPRVSDTQLNLVYNACDVGVNTAMCEGWGLVSFEHAATGAAQIVPRHTACEELWHGSALMLPAAATYIHPPSLEEVFVISPQSVADALQHLYDNRPALSEWREAAYRNATRPEWSWRRIATQWRAVFDAQLAT